MDKAKIMMEKMGWDSGKGLGKDETGIVKPIRLPYQTTKIGFGYDTRKDDFWWEDAFNNAAKNINVKVEYPSSEEKIRKDKSFLRKHDFKPLKSKSSVPCNLKSIHKNKEKNKPYKLSRNDSAAIFTNFENVILESKKKKIKEAKKF